MTGRASVAATALRRLCTRVGSVGVALIGAGLITVSLTAGAAPTTFPAPHTEEVTPQLSISVTDGHDETSAGSTLTYTVTVQNLGSTDAPGLVVSQTLPPGVTFVSADIGGSAQNAGVGWTIDVPAAQAVTLTSSVTVGDTPADLLRLASTTCASVSPTAAPVVCATDSDLLPAGARATAEAATQGASDSTAWLGWALPAVIGLIVLLLLAAVVLAVRRRRRETANG